MPAASEVVIDCTALHMHHSFGGGGYLQVGGLHCDSALQTSACDCCGWLGVGCTPPPPCMHAAAAARSPLAASTPPPNLQLGFAAGYQQPFGAHVGEDVYAGYAQHHAQMLQQPYEQPLYGRQASTREWPQTQQPYCGAPPVQPPYRPLQSMQGRGRPQHGSRGSSQHYGGRGRGWGRR